ncbi:helix-turn-helix domain-containing protein [Mycobacterium avium]|uniref:helix-turn-helix domain-containing protein n=1 Tax=Mycobacterium avium TaxID=1764 RepID=UPI0009C03BBE
MSDLAQRRPRHGDRSKDASLMLERGLALLNAIANHEEGALTISELASEIGTSRATVYRLLGPLQDEGFVRRDGSGVRLGLGLMRLASKVLPHLRAVTTPTLRNLAERVGATAHLTGGASRSVVGFGVRPEWLR